MTDAFYWGADVSVLNAELHWVRGAFNLRPGKALRASDGYRVVAAFDSGRVITKRFFESLQCLMKSSSSREISIIVCEPDPIEAYWKKYGVAPTANISSLAGSQYFLDMLHCDLGDSGDSVASNVEEFVLFDDARSWVVLVENSSELARIFVRDDCAADAYICCIPEDWRFNGQDISQHLKRFGISESEVNEIACAIAGAL